GQAAEPAAGDDGTGCTGRPGCCASVAARLAAQPLAERTAFHRQPSREGVVAPVDLGHHHILVDGVMEVDALHRIKGGATLLEGEQAALNEVRPVVLKGWP
ncbi:hypothetical protein CSC81_17925, partial [Tenacibaculum discolor]